MSISSLDRGKKYAVMIFADVFFVSVSLWLAFALRLNDWFFPSFDQLWLFISAPILATPVFINFGLYREVVRFISYRGMLSVIKASGIFVLLWWLVVTTILPAYFSIEIFFPRSIPILFWIALLLTIGGSRQVARWLLLEFDNFKADGSQIRKNVLIYGAGRAGSELASSLSYNKEIHVIGFIDDNDELDSYYLQNLKVLGNRSKIKDIRTRYSPLEILLAMPNMLLKERKNLLRFLEDKKVAVRTVPSIQGMARAGSKIDDLQNIDVIDLLARNEVKPDQKLLIGCVTNQRILVTGAGGSIGSELCRQVLKLDPDCVVLFEHSELHLYQINRELIGKCKKINSKMVIVPVLGSINNEIFIEETIKKFKIDTIYHAAAYKHVHLIENNVWAGIQNNIFGTLNVVQAAVNQGVKKFILISTDKAVNPTSVMGATKRISELIIQSLSKKNRQEIEGRKKPIDFAIVRFGNVLGSSGSVVPLFQQQIAAGGPITITHPEATRYFMTAAEASELVIQAGSMADNCSIFVLDMGDPVSILSLAKQMIYLSGNHLKFQDTMEDGFGIEIKYTGLQKGEKLHEELFNGANIMGTKHAMIMTAREESCEWSEIKELFSQLQLQNGMKEDQLSQLVIQFVAKRSP